MTYEELVEAALMEHEDDCDRHTFEVSVHYKCDPKIVNSGVT